MDPGEGLLRARLFLAELPDQVGTVHEPFQFPRDSRHALFQSSFVSEGAERGLPVDVGPERGDLAMELVDPVLGLVASLLVLVLREVELPPCRARGGLALLVVRLRFLQPVPFLPEAIEVFDFFLEGGSLRLEFGGDLTLVSDFCLAGLQGFQPRRAVLEGRRRPHPPFRSEEHTSELQSRSDLVCRLLLEKKKQTTNLTNNIQTTVTRCTRYLSQ